MLSAISTAQKVGAGVMLKAVGSGYRLADYKLSKNADLLQAGMIREGTTLGLVAAATYGFERLYMKALPFINAAPQLKAFKGALHFAPLFAAYVGAEAFARHFSGFGKHLKEELAESKRPNVNVFLGDGQNTRKLSKFPDTPVKATVEFKGSPVLMNPQSEVAAPAPLAANILPFSATY